ncbi:unnamed protein product [Rangifer tarandus platyrhynchus]|uniref:Uncharacterized protein n=1 Tax=Rangifer tarandus platyrhynchus TaxID=3082113 RepID=A0AC59YLM3_RANTA
MCVHHPYTFFSISYLPEGINTQQKTYIRTSLMVQWLRLPLPMQWIHIPPLVREPRSHMPCGQKPKTSNRSNMVTNSIKTWPTSKVKSEVVQLCPTLFNPVDCSPPVSSLHGILQARILEWVAISSPGDIPNPGIGPGSPAFQADSLTSEPPGITSKEIFKELNMYQYLAFKKIVL